MSVAVLAEKPSVARDIARVLGASERGEGFLRGSGYVVTWAIGHLVRLAEPPEIRAEWKRWAAEALPLLPERWPLLVSAETKKQFDVVARILRDRETREVVCATDAGREGELIFRYIYEASGCARPVKRLWISSLTPEAIRKGFAELRPSAALDALADSAHGRARADWLVGMNLSRAATLAHGELFSVGRVQTPTLALLVEREKAIRAFVPEDYHEVVAQFAPPAGDGDDYRGTWFRGERPTPEARRLAADGKEARAIVERTRQGKTEVESVSSETRHLPPPQLYDLTELQRHANRLYGLSARHTLTAAQSLYETHKLLTYPRTDSRHLSRDVAAGIGAVVETIAEPYRAALAPGTGERPLGRRFVDDAKVTDHHAIVPTSVSPANKPLSPDERRVYDLVCRRLLMAWHEEHVFAVTSVVTRVTSGEGKATLVDRFASSGTAVQQQGWKVLEPAPVRPERGARGEKGDDDDTAQGLPPGLVPGLARRVAGVEALMKKTRPPRRFTDATLLTAMETAGATLDDRELSEAMKERGLGTPATRAETIETLLRRRYAERQGKALAATDTGIRLIDAVHPQVKSAALTGEWEAQLDRIRRGEVRLPDFMKRIEAFVSDLVGQTLSAPAPDQRRDSRAEKPRQDDHPQERPAVETSTEPPRAPRAAPPRPPSAAAPGAAAAKPATVAPPRAEPARPADAAPQVAPAAGAALARLLRERFRLESFRPHQQAVCQAVADGSDVLLVMPTGAGKSLCFQLPGLARGGTTLVVTPLIALMEDQVQKLRELGLRAERIHSGRERTESRSVSRSFLDGQLDFLFIAPERLRVSGFPEMLARRPLALVAVDEAHCISEWGHDFRPDYRLLGERLPALRPAPIIALTATATPRVQADIAEQLGLHAPRRFIHGFRRTNIAIEVAGVKQGSSRGAATLALLRNAERVPAIVYTPTRKGADELAVDLHTDARRAAAYHAGMAAPARDRVQSSFLAGEIDVVVATIAFGMGVDKPDVRTVVHTGLPSSVEGYYQEIGRAGRDGHPSRAVLLYSYGDRRTHEFFLNRDYPEPAVLERVFRALTRDPVPVAELERRARLAPDELATALDKLWIHGGAVVEGEEAAVGRTGWRPSYLRQREHKEAQLDEMLRFAESHGCRMLTLLRHFGDEDDCSRPCGRCDACDPGSTVVRSWREPSAQEAGILGATLAALRGRDGQSSGQLHRECGGRAERREYEGLLGGLARAGLISVARQTFEKDGRTIPFQRVSLTREGRTAGDAEVARVALEDEGRRDAPSSGRRRSPAIAPQPKPQRRRTRAALPAASGADGLSEALRAWRLAEARKRGIPAFRILTDRALFALVEERPSSEEELLAVPGLGPKLVERHGAALLTIVAATR
jgi:DNA topoisomerase III